MAFQRPKCSICRIYFKAPFMYEQHRCSLDHLRNKARSENVRTDDENSDGDVERDLENFTTVDSVGDVDDEDAGDLPDKDMEKDEADEEYINIGIEHVNKVEVYYCDLCRYFFPIRKTGTEEARLKRHCMSKGHLRAYLQFKDDELLRQDAERLAKKKKKKAEEERKKKEKAVEPKIKSENGEVVVKGEKNGTGAEEEKKETPTGISTTENGKEPQEDEDELEINATDEIAQELDNDVVMLDQSNYEDDEDSRINSER